MVQWLQVGNALPEWWQQGVAVGVLAWLMFRVERILKELTVEVQRNSRTQLLFILGLPATSPGTRQEAERLLQEIDGSTRGR